MTKWLKSESVRVNSGEKKPFVTDLVVGGAAGNYVRVASALEVEQRDEIERLRAALQRLRDAVAVIYRTQVYEEPGNPAKGLNVEFIAAINAAARLAGVEDERSRAIREANLSAVDRGIL